VHQRDFILRIIEQLGHALIELRRRITGGERTGEVRATLAEVAGRAGLDLELLRGFDLPTLLLFARPHGEVEPTRCWLMAELLYLDGLEAHLSGRDGKSSLAKARALYDMIRPAGGMVVGMPEAAERIEEIDRMLSDESEPDDPSSSRRRRRDATGRALRPRASIRSTPDLLHSPVPHPVPGTRPSFASTESSLPDPPSTFAAQTPRSRHAHSR